MSEYQALITVIQTVGFPIVMVVWFMLRTEKVINRNTDALEKLTRIEAAEIEVMRQLAAKSGVNSDRISVLENDKEKST